jgi:hypothetical protein
MWNAKCGDDYVVVEDVVEVVVVVAAVIAQNIQHGK